MRQKKYSEKIVGRARKYFLMGLSINDISMLTKVPRRTVEKWYIKGEWKTLRNNNALKSRAKSLRDQGISVKVIAQELGVSNSTISRYCNN